MTRYLYRLALEHCEGRLFLALEGGYNTDMIARCTVECVNTLVLGSSGLSACEIPPLPSPAMKPMASPQMSSSLPPTSPSAGPFNSPKVHSKIRGGAPSEKTVSAVRNLTQ